MKASQLNKAVYMLSEYMSKRSNLMNMKKCLKDKKTTLSISSIYPFFSCFLLTQEETDLIIARLENELESMKKELEDLGVEVDV